MGIHMTDRHWNNIQIPAQWNKISLVYYSQEHGEKHVFLIKAGVWPTVTLKLILRNLLIFTRPKGQYFALIVIMSRVIIKIKGNKLKVFINSYFNYFYAIKNLGAHKNSCHLKVARSCQIYFFFILFVLLWHGNC